MRPRKRPVLDVSNHLRDLTTTRSGHFAKGILTARLPPGPRAPNSLGGTGLKRRTFRRVAGSVAVLATTTLAPLTSAPPAQAFCATPYEWPGSYLYANIGGAVPSGWHNAIKASMNEWNNISGANWTIQWTSSSDVAFTVRYSNPSGGFGGAPGVTAIQINASNQVVGGDVYLNPNWSWNLNGNLNQANKIADVRTVTVHELGHELVLTHPNQCGAMTTAEKNSAMNPDYTKKWNINSDDKAGAAFMK